MTPCLIRLYSAMCCTGEQSATATSACVGKGSSLWCREFAPARVISLDPLSTDWADYRYQEIAWRSRWSCTFDELPAKNRRRQERDPEKQTDSPPIYRHICLQMGRM